jgi:hypothetical protein
LEKISGQRSSGKREDYYRWLTLAVVPILQPVEVDPVADNTVANYFF